MRFTITMLLALSCFGALAQKSEDASYTKGKAFYDEDKYPEAIAELEKAVKRNASNEDALYYLGLSYYYGDQSEKSIPIFQTLEKLNPDYWGWFYYTWGAACLELHRYDEAITAYEKFEAKFPNGPTRTADHHKAQYRLMYARASSRPL